MMHAPRTTTTASSTRTTHTGLEMITLPTAPIFNLGFSVVTILTLRTIYVKKLGVWARAVVDPPK